MCPSRDSPRCVPASLRYRTHDGTCNNARRPRWGSAQMPFNRFLAPEYQDGVEGIRRSVTGATLPSARFVSLVVHGSRDEEAPVTMMLALWGQLIDHDLTATAQPRSINGSTPRCCNGGEESTHPSCLPIKVPHDDPWLSHLGVRCLEFLRSAPAQRRDCLLSWREQTNQATAYLDASPIYSSNPRSSDNARIFRQGMLLFGRGPPHEDVCFRAALANQCIRPGDSRSGEQPGLLMMHMVWVNEHNQIASRLATLNPHWSDEKVYQEARRIVGALFQHITFREFLPLVLGRDVCRLFDLELETSGHYRGYDANVNPTVANEFAGAAFRFGHSLIQHTYMRADRHHRFIGNNVSLHEDTSEGDFGGPGSLHRLLRGMVNQRALKRDEFITPELTNHLFQTKSFPFGLDLAAINIQRGRDHGLPAYVSWRGPCGLSSIRDWDDLDRIMGSASTSRLRKAYRTVDDIDLFVGGLAERPVVGGIVGPTFACIIAQQFSNLRKGDRFWYENAGFESSFTPAQLESIRQVAFAQVLCRALGGGGSLQPFVFLPPDFGQNERLACDARLMAPIDLDPWTERDPFTNTDTDSEDEDDDGGELPEGNSPSATDLLTAQSTFSAASTTTTSTTRRPVANVVNKVDLVTNGNTGLQQQPRPTTITKGQPATLTVAPTVLVSNKLDLSHQSTNRPSAGATAVDHKLDLKGTTKPTTLAATKRKPTRKPTTTKKRPSASLVVSNNLDFSATRSANATLTPQPDTRTLNGRTKRAASPGARHGYGGYQTPPPPTGYGDYDEDSDYDSDYDPPYLAYGYHRPTTPTTTAQTPPPYGGYYNPHGGYYTAPPTPPPQPPYPYLDTRRPNHGTRTTPRRRLSDKLTLNHDPLTNQPQRHRTTSRPDETPNKPFKKPSAAAHSSVFSVDFRALASNRRRTLHANLPSAANGTTSVATLLSDLPSKLSESFSVDDYDDDQDNRLTPTDDKLTSSSSKQDFGDHRQGPVPDDHDGYLRPEQTHFEPLVRQTATAQTYRDYWHTERRHYRDYYPDRNGLHHGDVPQTLVRYASAYDKPLLLDDYSDKFVGLLRDEDALLAPDGTSGPTNQHTSKERSVRTDDTKDTRQTKDKRPTNHRLKVPGGKPSSISLVPFVLLTNIDRPDNWVMYHSKPSKHRKPPVPLLKSDVFSLNELPTPIVGPD
ncbi:uncharacterized protein LOC128275474 [Anopheles cruzii]|uniref:uncharacterized protein LOC128275474 n=1 Tax=Anopheles cruzii TaxID=68878 RepID=UPI0022EC4CDF|nr:uncharacterized protein LOC128275474 [Anopheles cruzii]XP_052869947.1 uncharacterized protein LOC128275474 [Anopheles cruzii]